MNTIRPHIAILVESTLDGMIKLKLLKVLDNGRIVAGTNLDTK